jgi:hypothetical protein
VRAHYANNMKKINGASHHEKDLSIKTVAVEIKVMTVDGKRMTKSVFDQIPESDPFDEDFELKPSVQVMGYVLKQNNWSAGPDRIILFSENGQLKKYNAWRVFSSYEEAAEAGFFRLDHVELEDIIPAIKSLSYEKGNVHCLAHVSHPKTNIYDKKEIDKCVELMTSIYSFIESIKDEQIYISI